MGSDDIKTLGARIRYARKRLGLNQTEASKLLGVSNVVLNRYERDTRHPDPATIKLIADTFHVSSDYLLGLTDDPDTHSESINATLTVLPRKKAVNLERLFQEEDVELNGVILTDEQKRDLLGLLRIVWPRN